MKRNVNILYLYEEVMGYTLATIKCLVKSGADIYVVHWDHKKITPFVLDNFEGVNFYPRSKLNSKSIGELIEKINPDLTVVSGWNDSLYLEACSILKKSNSKVILAIDGYWRGGLRQNIAKLLGYIKWFNRYYSHAWVPGIRQFLYAKKLGFKDNEIIHDLYSADLTLFNQSFCDSYIQKKKKFPHRFIYVGRFELVKGLEVLLSAWEMLGEAKGDWDLHLIGHGSIEVSQKNIAAVKVSNFMQPSALVREVVNSGCFVLPSLEEPWGVVTQEFSAAGLPLILSDSVGSSNTFLISGYNGFSFRRGNAKDLARRMMDVINMHDDQLIEMAYSSHNLAQKLSPNTSAGNLLSLIFK